MSLLIVLPILATFAYLACNLGADRRPGHEGYGCKPVAIALILAGICLLAWPLIGPLVTVALGPILHNWNH